jgi:hypothetical protein
VAEYRPLFYKVGKPCAYSDQLVSPTVCSKSLVWRIYLQLLMDLKLFFRQLYSSLNSNATPKPSIYLKTSSILDTDFHLIKLDLGQTWYEIFSPELYFTTDMGPWPVFSQMFNQMRHSVLFLRTMTLI